jgi:WD40 repeat protein
MAMTGSPEGEKPAVEIGEPSINVSNTQGILIGKDGRQTNFITVIQADADESSARHGVTFSGKVDSPYQGLASFSEEEAAFFFGREEAGAEILKRLSGLQAEPALLVVSGESGAGKSSLLQAGVLPRIAESGLAYARGGQPWPHVVLTPAKAPLSELAGQVARLVSKDAATLLQALRLDPAGFALTALEAATRADAGEQGRLVVVVDQFEEVFTQCRDELECRAFIKALHAAATVGHGSRHVPAAVVILVVRADFETRCARYEELADAVQHRYLLGPMTELQLRLAIIQPARQLGCPVENSLVDELVRAVYAVPAPGLPVREGGSGALPHLSYALDQAWRARTSDELTLADYVRVGGIGRSIADSANRAYARLPENRRQTAREVFMRLTAASADGPYTAARATLAELTDGKDPDAAADIAAVVETFATERLFTLSQDSVEISHEALLTTWPLLGAWLADSHADLVIFTRLRNTATEWARTSDKSFLYRGTLLQAALEVASRFAADPVRNPQLGPKEREFLGVSDREAHRTTGRRRTAISALAVLTVASLIAAGLAVFSANRASEQAAAAARQHDIALSRQLATESLALDATDPVLARQLAVSAWSVYHTPEAGSAMGTLTKRQLQQGILPSAGIADNGAAFSPDGSRLATADSQGDVNLFDVATGQPIGTPFAQAGSGADAKAVAFSHDGSTLAVSYQDENGSTIRLYNTADGRQDWLFHTAGPVWEVAFSPDGRILAGADDNGTVILLNPATGKQLRAPLDPGDQVTALAFSPDGKTLAAADFNGAVSLYNTKNYKLIKTLDGEYPANTVAFDPNRHLLAAGYNDGTVRIFNSDTGKLAIKPIAAQGPFGLVESVAFSPDGSTLAVGGMSATVGLFNPATGRQVKTLAILPSDSFGSDVTFSRSGMLAVTGNDSSGSVVQIWNPKTWRPAERSLHADIGITNDVSSAAVNSNGTLTMAYSDGSLDRLTISTGRQAQLPLTFNTSRPYDDTNIVTAVAPQGKLIAIGNDADYGLGVIGLLNPVTGKKVSPLIDPSSADGYINSVVALAFSENAEILAAAYEGGLVRLFKTSSGKQAGKSITVDVGSYVDISALALNPHGDVLAIAADDGTVRLFKSATGKQVGSAIAVALGGTVTALAFSADGGILAAADGSGTVHLFSTATGHPVGIPLPADVGPGASISAMAFSLDGGMLFTIGSDYNNGANGSVRLWPMPLFTNPYAALCAEVGAPAQDDWEVYEQGEAYPKNACT